MGALPPSEGIRALVSGYAAPIRAKKLLTVLQAYTDDSAAESGDQRLFLAGFIHTAEGWTAFSDLWAAVLAHEPAVEYLHMVEANNLRGQFKGWSERERDDKLWSLARVVRAFAPMSFQFSVSRRDYHALVSPTSPRGMQSPYFVSIFGVVSAICSHVSEIGIKVPIDFIFDEQDGASDDIALFFSHMKKNLPPEAQALINSNPIFRSDRQVLPLQAADMLAWHIRREHEFGAGPRRSLEMADALRNPKGHLTSGIPEPDLRRWGKTFKKMPGISLLQSKSEWRGIKSEIRRLNASGVDPATIKVSKQDANRILKQANARAARRVSSGRSS